jgi:hypothetical protein
MKKCKRCNSLRALKSFFKDKSRKSGLHPWCKKCDDVYRRMWKKKNPELDKLIRMKTKLKIRYGMTLEERNVLSRKQKNKCAICKKKFVDTPHIDHSHKTGKVRGLLCLKCNVGVSNFNDSIIHLKKAILYLEKNGE